ncbi:hypothetical protein ABIB25_004894 [Nakamurella sp. UYEF19]|uniref:hypothetical protein n=1 Tax=Nakamurella sp. UYEF19 TaxID=1756392 RepID=UPI003396BC45
MSVPPPPGQYWPAPPYPQYAAPPPRKAAGWPILLIGLVVALVVGGVHGFLNYQHAHPSNSTTATPSPTSPSKTTQPRAALDAPRALADQLSFDIGSKNEKAYLSHFSGAAVAPATLWWNNMTALGFDYGAAAVGDRPPSQATSATLTLTLGVHSPLMPVMSGASDGTSQLPVPGTAYTITLTDQPTGFPLVTAMKGTSNAPWDQGALYVNHQKNVTVAGLPAEKKFVDTEAAKAQRAADWVLKFLGPYAGQVHQKGFVAFVSADAKTRAGWLQTAPKGRGWVADPSLVAGLFTPLASVQGAGDDQLSVLTTGYVILGSTQKDPVDDLGTMVHEFAHNLASVNDLWSFGDGKALPAWVVEGWARYIEAYYHYTPTNPLAKKPSAKPFLSEGLVKLPHPAFAGTVPTDAQVYGNAKLADYYYDLGASVYEYLSITYGPDQGFHSMVLGYSNGAGGPFTTILESKTGSELTYTDPDVIEAGWAKWYRTFYGA